MRCTRPFCRSPACGPLPVTSVADRRARPRRRRRWRGPATGRAGADPPPVRRAPATTVSGGDGDDGHREQEVGGDQPRVEVGQHDDAAQDRLQPGCRGQRERGQPGLPIAGATRPGRSRAATAATTKRQCPVGELDRLVDSEAVRGHQRRAVARRPGGAAQPRVGQADGAAGDDDGDVGDDGGQGEPAQRGRGAGPRREAIHGPSLPGRRATRAPAVLAAPERPACPWLLPPEPPGRGRERQRRPRPAASAALAAGTPGRPAAPGAARRTARPTAGTAARRARRAGTSTAGSRCRRRRAAPARPGSPRRG